MPLIAQCPKSKARPDHTFGSTTSRLDPSSQNSTSQHDARVPRGGDSTTMLPEVAVASTPTMGVAPKRARTKDSPFDFSSFKHQLPPNTGPPGTVATNSNSSSSKNLSHVPCKFFKQGICQAGNSCPFLHSLDGMGTGKLPCKYFQKGNCKFGLKCALAHILPDGTRVNTRDLLFKRHSSVNGSLPHVVCQPANAGGNGSNAFSGYSYTPATAPPTPSDIFHQSPSTINSGVMEVDSLMWTRQPLQQPQLLMHPSPPRFESDHAPSAFRPSKGRAFSLNPLPPLQHYSPLGHAGVQSPLETISSSYQPLFSLAGTTSSSFSSVMALHTSSRIESEENDSAIVDEFFYEEDYVPSSLSGLLTPSELERRDTRLQSGTLLVRPNVHQLFNEELKEEHEAAKPLRNDLADGVFLME